MFVWSMKMKKRQVLMLLIALLFALAVVLYLVMGRQPKGDPALKFSTTADLVTYIETFGWEVEPLPCEEVEVTVPEEFDEVYLNYNEIQRQQGFDLTEYQGKRVRRSTFVLLNYPGYPENMRADVLTYENQIVGADICSLEIRGFMHGMDELQEAVGLDKATSVAETTATVDGTTEKSTQEVVKETTQERVERLELEEQQPLLQDAA